MFLRREAPRSTRQRCASPRRRAHSTLERYSVPQVLFVVRSPWGFHRCFSWTRLLTCTIAAQRVAPMVLTVLKTVQVPQLQSIDKFVVISVVVVQRQVPMVLTVAETRGDSTGSAVAVHQQIRRHPCRLCATTGAHGPDCAEVRGDSKGAFLGQSC